MSSENRKWSREEIRAVYDRPLMQLVFDAAVVHRENNDPLEVQVSKLISVKTGGCSEDCGYCPQAARYHTGVENQPLMSVDEVRKDAEDAKASGASRLCMGAAWRNVKEGKDFDNILEMVRLVNGMDMEVCCTLGMITDDQARRLADAGLYAYNHNVDTSEDYYKEIISTRAYDDRLKTIENVQKWDVGVCSGGIIGMGESIEDRVGMLYTLVNLDTPPASVPINALVPVEGTPMAENYKVPIWDVVRMIATARIVLPKASVRMSAGRLEMSMEGQAMCFMAGANSVFAGDKLLTTPNPEFNQDKEMFDILGLKTKAAFKDGDKPETKESYKEVRATEKPKWSRPGHSIDANITASKKGKEEAV
ncbi:MAG: biotin synthase BioB [Flavobacteriales bacterium]|nr:biotin synthase BioB [Flavobacteriales bacterium]